MRSNLTKVMEREGKLEDLERIGEQLEIDAGQFKKNTANLKKKKMWENHRMKLLIGGVVLLVITIIVIILCL